MLFILARPLWSGFFCVSGRLGLAVILGWRYAKIIFYRSWSLYGIVLYEKMNSILCYKFNDYKLIINNKNSAGLKACAVE